MSAGSISLSADLAVPQGDRPSRTVLARTVLERDAEDLGGSSIVCIDWLSKAPRTAAQPRDHKRVKRYGDEFRKRRTVLE